jgi:large subunit ribosomal protein L4
VHVVEGFVTDARPSTKAAVAALAGLTGADQTRRRTLIVLERGDDLTWLSLRNVDTVHLLAVDQLNTYDVLLCDDVVFTKAAYDTFVASRSSGTPTQQAAAPVAEPADSTPETTTDATPETTTDATPETTPDTATGTTETSEEAAQ